jgi:hypothetical protein
MKNVVSRDTFVVLRLDIKNQETFHRKIFKRGGDRGVLWGVFVFHLCTNDDAFYRHILSHINNIECEVLLVIRNG